MGAAWSRKNFLHLEFNLKGFKRFDCGSEKCGDDLKPIYFALFLAPRFDVEDAADGSQHFVMLVL